MTSMDLSGLVGNFVLLASEIQLEIMEIMPRIPFSTTKCISNILYAASQQYITVNKVDAMAVTDSSTTKDTPYTSLLR